MEATTPTLISSCKAFVRRKGINPSVHVYAVDALSAMAQGLFVSLLVGTILSTVGDLSGIAVLNDMGNFAKGATGCAMAVSIGYALRAPLLVLLSLAAVGVAANELGGAGGPLAVLIIAIAAAEVGKLVAGETSLDILVTPLVVIVVGCGLSMLFAPALGTLAFSLGSVVMWATDLMPALMGVIVAVVTGIALTLPISSAAICAALGLTGLAGGAALAGCCAQMVGFAVISFKANGVSGLISQGLGTSMLQMPNIVKKPIIWIPAIVASAVGGPVATCLFSLSQNGPAVASGMGTCGLVGPIGVYTGWVADGIVPGAFEWIGLLVISVVIPAAISLVVYLIMERCGWIHASDLSLKAVSATEAEEA